MKFAYKLSAAVIGLLAVIFTLGGILLINRMFTASLEKEISKNESIHRIESYSLENKLYSMGGYVDRELLSQYGASFENAADGNRGAIAIFSGNGEAYYYGLPYSLSGSYLPPIISGGSESTILRRYIDKTYMLTASLISMEGEEIKLVSMFDISRVYEERNDNIAYFRYLCAGLLLLSAVLIIAVSNFLSRGIKKLDKASREIAGGNYSVRADVRSNDEIGRLSQSFNSMANSVEEHIDAMSLAMKQKDDFISAFSHEIKTPMTTIIGYTGLLRAKEQEPEVIGRASDAIFNEAKRLEDLSIKLLGLMGLAEEEIKFSHHSIEELFAECRRIGEFPGMEIEYSFKYNENYTVLCEKTLICDLIYNLMINSAAAKPKDNTVHISARAEKSRCVISVCDRGCGIAEEEIPRLTEAFYMVDKSRARQEGRTGVGLALCLKIAGLHGGGLDIQSKAGQGTRVSFSLELWEKEQREK